ncbi:MAG: dephospho-CoA kinase, partial [Endomicrobiia bacterium]
MKKIVIGLTGGIASGKSTVLKEFEILGAKVIDSDKIAHKIIQKDKNVQKKIIKYFGNDILTKSGKISRKKLGKIVFANKNKLRLLEKITHPVIISEIKKSYNVEKVILTGGFAKIIKNIIIHDEIVDKL